MPHDHGLLIIGYGSLLRADDGAGQMAARHLADLSFDTIEIHQLTPELAERIAAARHVIFLDAHAEVPPGDIAIEPVTPQPIPGALEHHATPASLLRLAKEVYGHAPEASLFGLGGRDFSVGSGLTAEATHAVAQAVAEVLRRAR